MTMHRSAVAGILSTLAAGMLMAACGEDGQSLGSGQCPELPLYHWVHSGGGGEVTWERIGVDGKPLSTSQIAAIGQAESDRCITPMGTATNVYGNGGRTGGTGGRSSGTGGRSAADSGAD
jgi:hypothetical protein